MSVFLSIVLSSLSVHWFSIALDKEGFGVYGKLHSVLKPLEEIILSRDQVSIYAAEDPSAKSTKKRKRLNVRAPNPNNALSAFNIRNGLDKLTEGNQLDKYDVEFKN